jgi:hypothetical protein
MPRAAEASSHAVLAVESLAEGGWRIVIEA